MSQAAARHFLNDRDLWETYRLVVQSGSEDFLRFPKRKEGLSFNWEDEHGTERDLDSTFLEEKQATLRCSIIAATEAEFWQKRIDFYTQLSKPGLQRWGVSDHGRYYHVFFKEEQNGRKLTRSLKGQAFAVYQFDLVLGVDVSNWMTLHGAGPFSINEGSMIEFNEPEFNQAEFN